MTVSKISVIGMGNVGREVSMRLAGRFPGELVLVTRNDIIKGIDSRNVTRLHHIFPKKKVLSEGFDLDHADACCVCVKDGNGGRKSTVVADVRGTTDYAETKGSDIVVIAAGIGRKAGMDRTELLATNQEIVKKVVGGIGKNGKTPVIINVTNPSDTMTYEIAKLTGYPQEKVIGLGGVLDGARYRRTISEVLDVPRENVLSAPVIGEHGEKMVFVPELTEIRFGRGAGAFSKSLAEMLAHGDIDGFTFNHILSKTKSRGAEIIKGMGGEQSAFMAPGEAVAKMVELIAKASDEVACVSVPLVKGMDIQGKDIQGISIGLPVRLSKDGAMVANDMLDLMHPETIRKFHAAADAIHSTVNQLTL